MVVLWWPLHYHAIDDIPVARLQIVTVLMSSGETFHFSHAFSIKISNAPWGLRLPCSSDTSRTALKPFTISMRADSKDSAYCHIAAFELTFGRSGFFFGCGSGCDSIASMGQDDEIFFPVRFGDNEVDRLIDSKAILSGVLPHPKRRRSMLIKSSLSTQGHPEFFNLRTH